MDRREKNEGHMLIKSIFLSLRPRQWIKNIAVFAGLIFSQNFFDVQKVWLVVMAAFIFCIASSSIYLINDSLDAEQDKLHPHKKHRPIASGRLRVAAALSIAVVLLTFSATAAFMLDTGFFFLLALYLIIETLYSLYWKHIVIIDLFCIAAGFLLRVLAGAVVISVPISNWLFICTTFLSLFLALGKRRSEFVLLEGSAREHRQVLANYSLVFIDQLISIVTAATIFSYALYTFSPETVAKFNTRNLEYTVIFVVYGIFRYLYLIYQKKMGGAPERLLFADKPLLINLFLYFFTVMAVLYH
ncbi:MAG: decaprenyl-phosphate phosphoribosyltransferase [Candidatus Omnitrophota bacterium]